MPATASSSVVPYVHAEYATDDGTDDVVEVDPDVGLTPEDEDELLVLEVGPDGQKKKVIQTERLVTQGERYSSRPRARRWRRGQSASLRWRTGGDG